MKRIPRKVIASATLASAVLAGASLQVAQGLSQASHTAAFATTPKRTSTDKITIKVVPSAHTRGRMEVRVISPQLLRVTRVRLLVANHVIADITPWHGIFHGAAGWFNTLGRWTGRARVEVKIAEHRRVVRIEPVATSERHHADLVSARFHREAVLVTALITRSTVVKIPKWPAPASSSSSSSSSASAADTSSSSSSGGSNTGVYWGAYIDTSAGTVPWSATALSDFDTMTGKDPSILHWGTTLPATFEASDFNTARDDGAIPMVDFTVTNSGSLEDIVDGDYDSEIRAWADGAAAWGHPLFLRWGWEMNGSWFAWGMGTNGNTAAEYVAAFRHIHDIFTAAGATNVSFVWCPNVVSGLSTPLSDLYPGDSYVNWVAMDGYNWAAAQGDPWESFSQIFTTTYDQLRSLAPAKPIMVAETSSTESGGSKASWITDALTQQIPDDFPDIKALVWFNWDTDGMDWDINSSSSAADAFKAGIASSIYQDNHYADLADGPIPAP